MNLFFEQGEGPEGLAASFLSVGVQDTEDTREKEKYKAVLEFYRKDPTQIT
jgi:hypothetical protein